MTRTILVWNAIVSLIVVVFSALMVWASWTDSSLPLGVQIGSTVMIVVFALMIFDLIWFLD